MRGDPSFFDAEIGQKRLLALGFGVERHEKYLGVSADGGFYEKIVIRGGKVSSRTVQRLVNLGS